MTPLLRLAKRHRIVWRRWILCILGLWVGGMAVLAAEPMVVFLKNGDRITGEVVSQNEKRLIIKSAIAGRVTVVRASIDRLIPLSALNAAPDTAAATAPPPATTTAPAANPPPHSAPAVPSPPATVAAVVPTNAPPADPLIPGWFTGIWTNWRQVLQT